MTLLDAYALVSRSTACSVPDAVALVPLFGDILAACHDIDAPREIDAESLRAHDRSIRALDPYFSAVLPIRFGTVVADAESLRAALWSSRGEIAEALLRVDGCVQFTVRVFAARHESTLAPSEAHGPGTRYLEARRQALSLRHQRAVDRLAALEPLRRDERCELHDAPPLDASVYHLVLRAHLAQYEATLASLVDMPDPVRLRASGPWPTYAFTPGTLA